MSDRGDLVKADEYFHQALAIVEKLAPGRLKMATILNNLGDVARDRGDLVKADEYFHQALAIDKKLAPGSLDVAMDLGNLGEVARDRDDLAKAQEYFHQALAIDKKLASGSLKLAIILNDLGVVAQHRGAPAKGEEYFRQALEIRKKLAPESADYAETLAALAGIMRDKQQAEEAERLYSQAIDVLESQVAHLGGSSDIRADFRAKHADYYSAYSDLLLIQKQPELAFQVQERSRARTLLEMLAEAHLNIRQGADPSLLERERTLQVTLAAKSNRKINLLEGEHTDEQVASLGKEVEELLSQYQEVEGQVRASNPKYAALTQPQPLSAKEVQQQLLDADTVLLEYALGEKRSFVFLLTPTSLDSYDLPKRSEIEDTAHRVYDLLTSRNRWIEGESSSQRKERVAKGEAEYQKAAATLTQMILSPVAARLEGKRLLIVADGALQYVPFAVLPVPTGNSSKPAVPLVAEHEIVNLPSASVLALLRRQASGRRAALKELAVLADPVFDKDDPRIDKAAKNRQMIESASEKESIPSYPYQLTRSLGDAGLGTPEAGFVLPRLAFSRQEADAIMAVTNSDRGMEALDFKASRKTALSEELGQYRIVHFATHGLLDNQHPELSGLVLSLIDQEGKPQEGFLGLEDVYNLTLPADLVVLSACETGLGKQISGEGLVGLTRGFMYAGTSRVVASLWKVDDVATADLMGRFYRGMLKEGQRPAAALRQAQMEMQMQKRWTDPYYWAAFTIQGEWK
ncbi:MAG: CHAT domain-containing protein [Terriglobia bacterium]